MCRCWTAYVTPFMTCRSLKKVCFRLVLLNAVLKAFVVPCIYAFVLAFRFELSSLSISSIAFSLLTQYCFPSVLAFSTCT